MERGSDKHGPLLDEEMTQESDSLTKGDPVEARADEGRESEGPPETDPTPDRRLAGDRGMSPNEAVRPENLEWRHEIQRHLQGAAYPTDRDGLLASAEEMNAPDEVKDLLRSLPSGKTYNTLKEVWTDLGGPFE